MEFGLGLRRDEIQPQKWPINLSIRREVRAKRIRLQIRGTLAKFTTYESNRRGGDNSNGYHYNVFIWSVFRIFLQARETNIRRGEERTLIRSSSLSSWHKLVYQLVRHQLVGQEWFQRNFRDSPLDLSSSQLSSNFTEKLVNRWGECLTWNTTESNEKCTHYKSHRKSSTNF